MNFKASQLLSKIQMVIVELTLSPS